MSRLAAVLAGLAVAYAALYYTIQLPDAWRAGDFAALWSYGQVLREHGAATLYDPAGLQRAQTALGMAADERNPFPYPPGILPLLAPLGLLSFGWAYGTWIVLGLGLYIWACPGRLRWVALIAPGTTIEVIAGQTGLLSGALFLGGLRLVSTRPWLAGALFGVLTFKPQLGILVPVALIAMRAWRAVAGAVLSAGALTAVALLLYGADLGSRWVGMLPAYATDFAQRSVRYGMMPTVTANAAMLNAPIALGHAAQGVAILVAGAAAFTAFRRRPPGAPEWLLLAAATFLATPHAFVYDMPLLTGAALAYGSVDGCRRWVMPAMLALPAAMLWSGPVPVSGPMLAVVVAVLWLDGRRPRRFSTVSSSTRAANTATAATRIGSSSK